MTNVSILLNVKIHQKHVFSWEIHPKIPGDCSCFLKMVQSLVRKCIWVFWRLESYWLPKYVPLKTKTHTHTTYNIQTCDNDSTTIQNWAHVTHLRFCHTFCPNFPSCNIKHKMKKIWNSITSQNKLHYSQNNNAAAATAAANTITNSPNE